MTSDDPRVRVLVVDDHPVNARLLEVQLQSAGYDVVCCLDGLTALAELVRREFDVILLDILMPPPDGIETCRYLRAAETDRRRTPVLFVTALVDPEVHQRALAAGGDDVLVKPVPREELLARIERVLGTEG